MSAARAKRPACNGLQCAVAWLARKRVEDALQRVVLTLERIGIPAQSGGGFLAGLTGKRSGQSVHRSSAEPQRALLRSIGTVDRNPKPFLWHKSANDMLATTGRFC